MRLKDRHVWLIGASSGIGAALVPVLVREGARLAISARDGDALQAIAGQQPAPIVVRPLDVTDDGALRSAADELIAEWGQIDVLLYNAGTWAEVDVDQFDAEAFDRQIAVNYSGMVHAIAAVLPHMLERRSGDIVGVASLSAYGAFPRAEAYGSTKAAVNYLLASLRMDLRKRGVGVTTVNPGFVRTELTAHNDFPMPFMMEPDAAAGAIVAGLLAGHAEIHFPRKLSLPLKLLTALPRPAYEWIVGRTVRR